MITENTLEEKIANGTFHPNDYNKEELAGLIPYMSTDNYYEFGMLLCHLVKRCRRSGEFKQYCEAANYKQRTISFLIAIYKKLNALQIPPPRDIPWRLLGEAEPAINQFNYQEVFDFLRSGVDIDDVKLAVKTRQFFDLKAKD